MEFVRIDGEMEPMVLYKPYIFAKVYENEVGYIIERKNKNKSIIKYKEDLQMAIVKKCDRCGNYFEDEECIEKDITNRICLGIKNVKTETYRRQDYFDLCPKCGEEIDKWFKNPDDATVVLLRNTVMGSTNRTIGIDLGEQPNRNIEKIVNPNTMEPEYYMTPKSDDAEYKHIHQGGNV